MFVTRKADYAIRCVLYLAANKTRIIPIEEISTTMQVPRSFLAKILQKLTKSGIVDSTRGMTGGFRLTKAPKDINLLDVIESIQGVSASNICAVDNKLCNLSGRCSVHPVWVKLRATVEKELRAQNFSKLARQLKNK